MPDNPAAYPASGKKNSRSSPTLVCTYVFARLFGQTFGRMFSAYKMYNVNMYIYVIMYIYIYVYIYTWEFMYFIHIARWYYIPNVIY